jgi:hypothetical protein
MPAAEQRRSERILIDVPVVVKGTNGASAEGRPFQEETFTVTISPHGALVMLAAGVSLGQRIVLRNSLNQREQEARVAYKGASHAGLAQVGVEFLRESPEFWPINQVDASINR